MDVIEKMARDRGIKLDLGPFVEVDTERRKLITATEQMKAERNKANDIIGPLQKAIRDLEAKGQDVTDRIEQRDKLLRQMKESSDKIKRSDELVAKMDGALKEFLLVIPNIPHTSVPVGKSAADNVEVRRSGEPPKFDFAPRPHWELGERAGILDFESAVKIAGARFAVYKGLGARLERAIANFFLDVHTREHGYTEILPPFIVNTAALTGVGQLPKFAADMFHLEGTDLWLTPTAEVELTSLYRDETIDADELPIKVCAWTACFRSEAGAAGKDTRGIKRQHQFQKVELFKFTRPEKSYDELESLVRNAEKLLRTPGPPLSRDAALHRGHGICIGENVRHRSVAAFGRRIHGNFVLLEYGGVSGAALGDSVQAQGRQKRVRSHAERLRPGGRAHVDRDRRKFSAGRWLDRNSGSAGALHGSGKNQTEGLTSNRKKKSAERKSQTLHLRAALLNAESFTFWI